MPTIQTQSHQGMTHCYCIEPRLKAVPFYAGSATTAGLLAGSAREPRQGHCGSASRGPDLMLGTQDRARQGGTAVTGSARVPRQEHCGSVCRVR